MIITPSNTSHSTAPLELPEILTFVAYYLSNRDIFSCIRVCKSWYQSFIPLLWSIVSTNSNPDVRLSGPTLSLISKHATFIRSLEISGIVLPKHTAIHFPILQSLNLSYYMHPDPDGLPRKDEPSRENTLIRKNSTISELKLSSLQIHDHLDFWSTVRDLPNLKSLYISTTYIPHNVSEVFWQACSRLSAISFYYTPMPNIPSSGTYSFDSIASITLKSKQGDLTYQRQLELLKQCKGLHSIACHGGWDHMPLDDFSLCAVKGAWPDLHELDLDCSGIGDDVLQVLLNAMIRLSRLQVKFTGFGPNAFKALNRHFDGLKYLDIQKCKNVSNRMSHIIMCSCPNLIELQVTVFAASVIFEIDHQWVCTQLRSLKVYFDLEGLDMQTVILERLAGLTKLEYLDFGHWKDFTPGSYRGLPSIQLSLDKGMDLLRTCQRLTAIKFSGVKQEMSEQDLAWILENWKHLESVHGALSNDGTRHSELARIMESHHILVEVHSRDK